MKTLSKIYMWLIFALLYAPIIVLVIFSFNRAGSLNHFSTFSLYWYKELFRDAQALKALKNSLILAVSSSLLATVIGTFAALGIDRMKSKFFENGDILGDKHPDDESRYRDGCFHDASLCGGIGNGFSADKIRSDDHAYCAYDL